MYADYGATHMGMHINSFYRHARLRPMKTIGERIRDRRKEKGLRQSDLAESAGIDQSTISDIEKHNADFSARNLMKIAEALEVTPEWVMRGTKVSEIEELEVIAIYKSLDEPGREMLLKMIRPLRPKDAAAEPKKRKQGNGTTGRT